MMVNKIKRKYKILLHNIRIIIRKIKKEKKLIYKIRYISIIGLTGMLLIVGINLITHSYAQYESQKDIDFKFEKAKYIIKFGENSFNIDLGTIIPSASPYVYPFEIINYNNDETINDVTLEYSLTLSTTTNIPLEYRLYKGENYQTGTNILQTPVNAQDSDGAWYKKYPTLEKYIINHSEEETHEYQLLVYYPTQYKNVTTYIGQIEAVTLIISATQAEVQEGQA